MADVPPCTLLYVGSSPARVKRIEELVLQLPNIRLVTASNTFQGIKRAQTTRPDVILIDVNLPNRSEIKAWKKLQDDPDATHVPLIALTGGSFAPDMEKTPEGEVFCHMSEPLHLKDFRDTVCAALQAGEGQVVLASAGGNLS
jgi:two-component system sensor histidine kinase BarA